MTYTPTPVVEIAFGSDPFDGSPSWTDVSTYVRSVQISRGRPSEFDSFTTGSCKVEFNNLDRRFDPDHASSPYAGNLKPNVPIRVYADVAGTDYPRFYGFVEGFELTVPDPSNRLVLTTVRAYDAFALFANARLPLSVYRNVVLGESPRAYWPLGEVGPVAADLSTNRFDGDYGASLPVGDQAQDPLPPYSEFPSTRFRPVAGTGLVVPNAEQSGDVTVECWLKLGNPAEDGGANIFADSVTASSAGYLISWSPATVGVFPENIRVFNATRLLLFRATLTDYRPHHLVVRCTSGSDSDATLDGQPLELLVDQATVGWDFETTGVFIGNRFGNNAFSGFISDLSFWSSHLSDATIASHYEAAVAPWDGDSTGDRIGRVLDEIGWPAGLRDLDNGEFTLGPADIAGRTALDYMQAVAASEQGRLFMSADGNVTFHQRDRFLTDATETTVQVTFAPDDQRFTAPRLARDTRYIFNQASATREGGVQQTASDSTSITAYGPRTKNVSGLVLRDDSQARAIADYIVFRYKDPQTRSDSWSLQPEGQPSTWADVLTLEIGHRVALNLTPAGVGSDIELELHLESIRETITPSTWVVELSGSPVDPHADDYFIWGGDGATQGWGNGLWR